MNRQIELFIGLLFSLLILSSTPIEAQLPGFPPAAQVPPVVAKWTALVDTSKLPAAPVRKASNDCSDLKDPFCVWTCTICTRPDDIVRCPKQNDWGITYDDGPSPYTPVILDHLKAKNVKATFFVTGSAIMANAPILKRTVDEGHQVGIHTWSHTPLTTQTTEVVIAELKWTEEAIKNVTGLTPKTMRPPQGDYDDRIRGIAKQLGYDIVLWDYDTFDWMSNANPGFDINWVTGNFTIWAQNKTTGHITLEHDLYQNTAGIAPKAIDIVLNAGWKMKTVSDCTGRPAYLEAPSTSPKLDQSSSSSKSPASPTAVPTNSPNSATRNNNVFVGIISAVIFSIFFF